MVEYVGDAEVYEVELDEDSSEDAALEKVGNAMQEKWGYVPNMSIISRLGPGIYRVAVWGDF